MFELSIKNENLAAWMSINNAFSLVWPPAVGERSPGGENYWHGVLIQLGRFQGVRHEELFEGFKFIHFIDSKGNRVHQLEPSDFDDKRGILWINIVGAAKGRSRPEPAPLDMVRRNLKIGEHKTAGFEPPSRLHRYLQPYPGGITLWHDRGYSVSTKVSRNGGLPHAEQIFKLDDSGEFKVEVLRLARGKSAAVEPTWSRLLATKRKRKSAKSVTGARTTLLRNEVSWEGLEGRDRDAQELHYSDGDALPEANLWTSKKVKKIVISDTAHGQRTHGLAVEIHANPPQRP